MLCIINATALDMLNITNNIRAGALHRLTKLMTERVFSCSHPCVERSLTATSFNALLNTPCYLFSCKRTSFSSCFGLEPILHHAVADNLLFNQSRGRDEGGKKGKVGSQ